jgi:hypothetical protein
VAVTRARKPKRGRPPITGRYGKGSTTWRAAFTKTEAELVRLAAAGTIDPKTGEPETPAAYITRVALERARKDLT